MKNPTILKSLACAFVALSLAACGSSSSSSTGDIAAPSDGAVAAAKKIGCGPLTPIPASPESGLATSAATCTFEDSTLKILTFESTADATYWYEAVRTLGGNLYVVKTGLVGIDAGTKATTAKVKKALAD